MARRKKPDIEHIFTKGTEFFNAFNATIRIAKELLETINATNSSNNKHSYTVDDEEQIKKSAYRFMKLEPGCGQLAVKNRFREMVKEVRPDLKEGKENTDWYMALQVAKKTLLKYEK